MSTEGASVRRRVSASLLRLRSRAPFFATLALFARVEVRPDLPTAATDGRDIFVNPEFLASLAPAEVDGLMLHEVLHAALLHVPRCGTRDPLLWNIAADLVVNGMIAELPGFVLPKGGLRDPSLEKLSVEEVYELLLKRGKRGDLHLAIADLLQLPPGLTRADVDTYWRRARAQSATLAKTLGHGEHPAGMDRELGALEPSRLDWRAHLWRYLVPTPVDFEEFDRRHIGRGLYLETLAGEALRVYLAVDTSGSIDTPELALFLGEVQGILRAYPHVRCDLYYADAAAYGPYPLDRWETAPRPQGGGGTDFRPFFRVVEERVTPGDQFVTVYLTDGYGEFPDAPPGFPVLWVVTPGGLDLEEFPFGETVRLITAEAPAGEPS